MRVLLVEDEADLRYVIAAMMQGFGWDVEDDGGSGDALHRFESSARPDLLAVDIDLGPGDDGFSLAAAARQRWPQLPVLFLTGLWTSDARARSAGPEMVLQKPFTAAELKAAMDRLSAAEQPPG